MSAVKDNNTSIILGGLYTISNPMQLASTKFGEARNPSRTEQTNKVYIACRNRDTNEIWMLDTYNIKANAFYDALPDRNQAKKSNSETDNFISDMESAEFSLSNGAIMNIVFRCYYSNSTKVNDENKKLFEFVGYLPDYRESDELEVRSFSIEDVISNVMLWREHNWPSGTYLVRKDTSVVSELDFNASLIDFENKFYHPQVPRTITELENKARECPDYSAYEMEIARMRFGKMRQLQAEWQEFWHATHLLKDVQEWSALKAWQAGVPIDDIMC